MIVTSNVRAMGHHARLFARTHRLRFVPLEESGRYRDIYQLGIYAKGDYENIINRRDGRVILHWCGRDAFIYQRRMRKGEWGGFRPWP